MKKELPQLCQITVVNEDGSGGNSDQVQHRIIVGSKSEVTKYLTAEHIKVEPLTVDTAREFAHLPIETIQEAK